MTLTRGVVLPPTTPVGGGILDLAGTPPDGWTRGLGFATEACLIAGEHLFCPGAEETTEKVFQEVELAEFEPFGIEVSVQCTPRGAQNRAETDARAFQALVVKDEYSAGYVLATGTTTDGKDTGNPALADATNAGSAATAAEALALIENAIASNLRGGLAFVHMTPATLTALVDAGVVYRDGGSWRTPTGHVVVASPGYVGNLTDVIVATTEVYAAVGDIVRMDTVNREVNRVMVVHEAPAIVVFDPCFNQSVTITGTSP